MKYSLIAQKKIFYKRKGEIPMIFYIEITFYILCDFIISKIMLNNIIIASSFYSKKYKKITIRIYSLEQLVILILDKVIFCTSMMIALVIRYRDGLNGIITEALLKNYLNNIIIFEIVNTALLFTVLKINYDRKNGKLLRKE